MVEISKLAIVLTGGLFDSPHAKTAHGLVRYSGRFEIAGIVDDDSAGKDAGDVLEKKRANIPVYASVEEAISHCHPEFAIIGVATHGGVIPPGVRLDLKAAVTAGLTIVNGLHYLLSEDSEYTTIAKESGAKFIDIRQPRPVSSLRFWNGDIYKVKLPIVAVLGTDCAVGKRTAARFIEQELSNRGLRSALIYTGQTGWMQGSPYGIIFDTLPNDFVCGELEGAVIKCSEELKPDLILIEGQSSLRNPSGPCGAEMLLSANAKHVVLVHAPARKYFDDYEYLKLEVFDLESEIKLVEAYGSKVVGICLNQSEITEVTVIEEAAKLEQKLGIPVVAPVIQGVDRICEALVKLR
ncbi:MAG: DUF1611 domain-containing protein [Pseudohongiellaceae bacterium]